MKVKIAFTVISLFVVSILFAQKYETQFYEKNPQLGGDVVIKSAEIKCYEDEEVAKIFEVESPLNGIFYLDAWLTAPFSEKGLPEYKVAINDIVSVATLKPQTDSWNGVALTDKDKSRTTIKLKKGINYISIIGERPVVPEVEYIKLSSSSLNVGITNVKYNDFIERIKTQTLRNETNIVNVDSMFMSTKTTDGEAYTYMLDMPVYYTTKRELSLKAGEVLKVHVTKMYQSCIVEMYNWLKPETQSWSNVLPHLEGSPNPNSTVGYAELAIPETGTWIVRLRSYKNFSSHMVDLKINGQTWTGCPVGSSGLLIEGDYSSRFLTCYGGADHDLMLREGDAADGPVRAWTSNNTLWNKGFGTLITTSIPNLMSGIVTGVATNVPTTTCDIYLGLKPISTDIKSTFPNLNVNRSLISGPKTAKYNSISWAVGGTDYWYWKNTLAGFDSLFTEFGYTRNGATRENAAIALWVKNGEFTHASVTKNATIPKPHGFSWESKLGNDVRLMHLINDLAGDHYGSIAYYYKPKYDKVTSFNILPKGNKSTLSSSDLMKIEVMKAEIPEKIISDFEEKYVAWEKTWDDPEIRIFSNPRKYAETKEYNELYEFCRKYGKVTWLLFIEKLSKGDVFVSNLMEDLTFLENNILYDEVLNNQEQTTAKYCVYSNMVDYSKKLLAQRSNDIRCAIQNIPVIDHSVSNITVTNSNGNIVVKVNAEKETYITVNMYDAYGNLVYNTNLDFTGDEWSTVINASRFKKGTYVVHVMSNENKSSQKITI